jgi:polyhydroxyalkanoate synthesis regulator phasin
MDKNTLFTKHKKHIKYQLQKISDELVNINFVKGMEQYMKIKNLIYKILLIHPKIITYYLEHEFNGSQKNTELTNEIIILLQKDGELTKQQAIDYFYEIQELIHIIKHKSPTKIKNKLKYIITLIAKIKNLIDEHKIYTSYYDYDYDYNLKLDVGEKIIYPDIDLNLEIDNYDYSSILSYVFSKQTIQSNLEYFDESLEIRLLLDNVQDEKLFIQKYETLNPEYINTLNLSLIEKLSELTHKSFTKFKDMNEHRLLYQQKPIQKFPNKLDVSSSIIKKVYNNIFTGINTDNIDKLELLFSLINNNHQLFSFDAIHHKTITQQNFYDYFLLLLKIGCLEKQNTHIIQYINKTIIEQFIVKMKKYISNTKHDKYYLLILKVISCLEKMLVFIDNEMYIDISSISSDDRHLKNIFKLLDFCNNHL